MLLLLLCVHLLYHVAVLVLLAARSLPLAIKYVRLGRSHVLGHRGFWHVVDPEHVSDVQLHYAGGRGAEIRGAFPGWRAACLC
jgi:hypothetical protein